MYGKFNHGSRGAHGENKAFFPIPSPRDPSVSPWLIPYTHLQTDRRKLSFTQSRKLAKNSMICLWRFTLSGGYNPTMDQNNILTNNLKLNYTLFCEDVRVEASGGIES